jgi:acetyl-CoA C-acetyltransferase
MVNAKELADNTPVLVGAGQVVEREATDNSPMALAAQAAANAIANAGGENITAHIDTIVVIRLFSDMGHLWPCQWGRSNNPPQSIARIIGADPKHRIYSEAGGNEPQSKLIECARDIALGKRDMVLLAGAEALKNQRHAQRSQTELDWSEHFDEPLDDRGVGESVATSQEINNGLNNVAFYYALIEQAQRHHAGRTVEEHQQDMATLLASFSTVAASNPYAQFPGSQTAEQILSATPINHLYTKRMIAQDSVNQGAALLLCSLGKAKELGIPEANYIYIHGMAEGTEHAVSHRPNPAISPMANNVADRALDIAGLAIGDIDLIDIYSCFPCAITAIAGHLGLSTDGSRALTMTGGLPYFGGPGNNYSMHGLAEAVSQLRQQPNSYAMVTCNGGVLSKHAMGIYSRKPSNVDWASTATTISNKELPHCAISNDPRSGDIVSYTVHFTPDGTPQAIILGKNDKNEHFIAITAEDDKATAMAMLQSDPTGKPVSISPPQDEKLHFHLEEGQ